MCVWLETVVALTMHAVHVPRQILIGGLGDDTIGDGFESRTLSLYIYIYIHYIYIKYIVPFPTAEHEFLEGSTL